MQGYTLSFDIFKQLVLFVYMNFYVFVFDHLPAIIVPDPKLLSNNVFGNVSKDKGIQNIFSFLIRAINIEQIVR